MSADRIDGDDFIKFLNEKSPDYKCTFCGTEDFSIFTELVDGAGRVRVGTQQYIDGSHLELAVVACENCGLLTPHDLRAYRKARGTDGDDA